MRKRRRRNPHLTSGKWRFVGYFPKSAIGYVRRLLKIHGIKLKITMDQSGEKGYKELYVTRDAFQYAYGFISRYFSKSA